MPRYALQTALRAASVSLLQEYADELVGDPPGVKRLKLQVYRARPRTLKPPTGFVDAIRESLEHTNLTQRVPIADVVVLWGLFDSGDAVDQRDAFVDGFVDWSLDRIHEAGGNTTVAVVDIDDIPDFVPEWLPPEEQRTYYATRFSLRAEAWTA
jgi:hypothetical protein